MEGLDNPFSRPSLVEILFYILVVAVCAPILWTVLRCFTERLVIAIATVHLAITVVSWFQPTILNPVVGLFGRAFLVLWGLAFLMSLNMPVQSVRHPYIEVEKVETKAANQRLLILFAACAIALILGALLYFMPLR